MTFLAPYYPLNRNPHCLRGGLRPDESTVTAVEEWTPLAVYPPVSSPPAGYAPRQGGVGRSLESMTSAQIRTVSAECGCLLRLFGYEVQGSKSFSIGGNRGSSHSKQSSGAGATAEEAEEAEPKHGKAQKNSQKGKGKKWRHQQEEEEEAAAAAAAAAAANMANMAKSKGGKGKKGRRGEDADSMVPDQPVVGKGGKTSKGQKAPAQVAVAVSSPAPVAPSPPPPATGAAVTISTKESEFILGNNHALLAQLRQFPGRGGLCTDGLVINPSDVSREECECERMRGAIQAGPGAGRVECPLPVLHHLNRTLLIRDENSNNRGCDLYGRNIFNIRHMYTNDDKDPLPFLSR